VWPSFEVEAPNEPHNCKKKMNKLTQRLCFSKGFRISGVRFYGQAGYGNVSENPSDTGKYDQVPKTADEVATTQESVTEAKSGGKKASPEVKAARKKLREGDQDAVRDYTAGID